MPLFTGLLTADAGLGLGLALVLGRSPSSLTPGIWGLARLRLWVAVGFLKRALVVADGSRVTDGCGLDLRRLPIPGSGSRSSWAAVVIQDFWRSLGLARRGLLVFTGSSKRALWSSAGRRLSGSRGLDWDGLGPMHGPVQRPCSSSACPRERTSSLVGVAGRGANDT